MVIHKTCQTCFLPLLAVDDFSVELVGGHLQVLPDLLNRDAQVLLDVGQQLRLVVPDAAAALGSQAGVGAVLAAALAPLAVVPHLQTADENCSYSRKAIRNREIEKLCTWMIPPSQLQTNAYRVP